MRAPRDSFGTGSVLALALAVVASAVPVRAEPTLTISPVNGRALPRLGAGEAYSIWLVGHSYGESIFPTSSLLAAVPELNQSGAAALVLLGDTIEFPTRVSIGAFRRFSNALELPVFIAPGNHDLRDPALYAANFGPSFYDFRIGGELYIVLELNAAWGTPTPAAWAHLRRSFARARRDPEVHNVVVLSHHQAWAIDDERLTAVRNRVNLPRDYRTEWWTEDIAPLLYELAATKPVVWASGDRMGFPPLYWEDPDRELTYLLSGLAGDERDSVFRLHSDGSGPLRVELVSLSGQAMEAIETYSPAYWASFYADKTRIPDLRRPWRHEWVELWAFVSNRRFFAGLGLGGAGVAALAGIAVLVRSRRRRAS